MIKQISYVGSYNKRFGILNYLHNIYYIRNAHIEPIIIIIKNETRITCRLTLV